MKTKSNLKRLIVCLVVLVLLISLLPITVFAGSASVSLAGGANLGTHTQGAAQPSTREITFTHSYNNVVTVHGATMDSGEFFEFHDEPIWRDRTNIPAGSSASTGMFIRPTLAAMNTPGRHTVNLYVNYDVHPAGQEAAMGPGRYEVSVQLEIYITAAPQQPLDQQPVTPTPPVTPITTITPESAPDIVQQAINAATEQTTPLIRLTNPSDVSLASMQAVATAAAGRAIRINADTMVGTAVDVRIAVNPALATKDVNLSASTTSDEATDIAALFQRHFDGTMTVVNTQQRDGFGMEVSIAARIDSQLDAEALYFYRFNSEANTFRRIIPEHVSVDSAGFLRFTTTYSDAIVITNTRLHR